MARIDPLGLVGTMMVGGTAGYAAGSAAQQIEDRQTAERQKELSAAQIKSDGMIRLEQWKTQNDAAVAKQKHAYSMEKQGEELASKERIAGMKGSGGGKEQIKGVAGLRADYKKFIDTEFDSGADEGWWFGIGSKEGDEPQTFEEWAHGARPEEAKYYGINGGKQQQSQGGDIQLEGSISDIIGRVGLGGGAGDVVQPAPIEYGEPGPQQGMISDTQQARESEQESQMRSAYSGDEQKIAELNAKVKDRNLFAQIKKLANWSSGQSADRKPVVTGVAARNLASSAGLPSSAAELLMKPENKDLAYAIDDALRNNPEALAELIKQL